MRCAGGAKAVVTETDPRQGACTNFPQHTVGQRVKGSVVQPGAHEMQGFKPEATLGVRCAVVGIEERSVLHRCRQRLQHPRRPPRNQRHRARKACQDLCGVRGPAVHATLNAHVSGRWLLAQAGLAQLWLSHERAVEACRDHEAHQDTLAGPARHEDIQERWQAVTARAGGGHNNAVCRG